MSEKQPSDSDGSFIGGSEGPNSSAEGAATTLFSTSKAAVQEAHHPLEVARFHHHHHNAAAAEAFRDDELPRKKDARRAYNRKSSAHSRRRSKEFVSDLQASVLQLTRDKLELHRANEMLQVRMDLLESQNKALLRERSWAAQPLQGLASLVDYVPQQQPQQQQPHQGNVNPLVHHQQLSMLALHIYQEQQRQQQQQQQQQQQLAQQSQQPNPHPSPGSPSPFELPPPAHSPVELVCQTFHPVDLSALSTVRNASDPRSSTSAAQAANSFSSLPFSGAFPTWDGSS
jgi:hypothetical protein